jgi:hypothetical protein
MTPHDDAQHRQFNPDPGDVEVRQPEGGDGMFRIRLPVSSTAEARDGEAFERDRLEGWVRQIETGDVGVFLDHGRNFDVAESRYSALGKIGYWDDPEVRERDGQAELWPEAVIANPDEMDDDVGDIRAILAWLKHQAELGIPIATSVGWAEDTGDRDVPGGADLLEISLVGIPSDPATTTTASSDPAALARAVSTAADGFDVETFVRELERQAEDVDTVQVPEYDEAANPDGVSWDGLDLEDFEAVIDDPTPQDSAVYTKFAYSETGFPPADDAEFDSLGYPLVTVDGTLLWQALTDADEVHPAGLEGDEETAMGQVLIELSESEFPGETLPELGDESKNSADADTTTTDHDMTDDNTDSGEEPEDTNEDEDGMDAAEFRSTMLEMQEKQTETLEALSDAIRQDDEDEDDEDEDGDDDEDGENGDDMDDDEDEDDENSETPDEGRTVTLDGEEMAVDEALENLRDAAADADAEDAEAETQNHAEDPDEEDSEENSGFGFTSNTEGN